MPCVAVWNGSVKPVPERVGVTKELMAVGVKVGGRVAAGMVETRGVAGKSVPGANGMGGVGVFAVPHREGVALQLI